MTAPRFHPDPGSLEFVKDGIKAHGVGIDLTEGRTAAFYQTATPDGRLIDWGVRLYDPGLSSVLSIDYKSARRLHFLLSHLVADGFLEPLTEDEVGSLEIKR